MVFPFVLSSILSGLRLDVVHRPPLGSLPTLNRTRTSPFAEYTNGTRPYSFIRELFGVGCRP